MSSIKELYDSGFQKRNKDHFAAIVRVAMSDGVIKEGERSFLRRLAHRLHISDHEYNTILDNYSSYPINPPVTYERRLERLYDLTRMVFADDEIGERQQPLLERLSVGLGFTPNNVKYVVAKALELVSFGVDFEEFDEEIRNMNR